MAGLYRPFTATAMFALALALMLALAPSGTEAKGYYNAGYGRTYYYGPTRYYFYYGGVRHYHGTRTWGQCNGHCNQDVYIDQVSFKIYYASGTQADTMLASTAKTALSQVWPSIDPTLVTTAASSVGGPHVQFTALLPDGTGTYAFADAVKNSVNNYCLSNIPSPLSSTGMPVSCPQTVAVSVMQIATQAESGGAALTLPSLLCLVLAAVSTMSTMWR